MTFYDFIEIGTSDFDTEIQNNNDKIGISIEPVKYYLDKLPIKQQCVKLNAGVSNYNGQCRVNYLSEETIQKYNFPHWVRGCNCINSYHKTITNLCKEKSIDIEKISSYDIVDVYTLYQIMKLDILHIDGVYFLKIDTEGHDCDILKQFYVDIKNNYLLPHVIKFESNGLSSNEDVEYIIFLYSSIGYDLIVKEHDTILKLNLHKIKNKHTFTNPIHKYYIMDYPDNYNILQLPHDNTLEAAKEYCIKNNCSGVTLQDGIYQVRNGKYINYFDDDIYSWVYII
jgi:hypothetical protein